MFPTIIRNSLKCGEKSIKALSAKGSLMLWAGFSCISGGTFSSSAISGDTSSNGVLSNRDLARPAASYIAPQHALGPIETTKSRELVASFSKRLKLALMGAMKAGGPVEAIKVCKEIAPQVASELSRESGAKVSRTSLKVRNPNSIPEPWQIEVLNEFERKISKGLVASSLEYSESISGQVGTNHRYMKAIPTAGLCLTCHGTDLAPKVQQALAAQYPYDQAIGYTAGDIRGAFSVIWTGNDQQTAVKTPTKTYKKIQSER